MDQLALSPIYWWQIAYNLDKSRICRNERGLFKAHYGTLTTIWLSRPYRMCRREGEREREREREGEWEREETEKENGVLFLFLWKFKAPRGNLLILACVFVPKSIFFIGWLNTCMLVRVCVCVCVLNGCRNEKRLKLLFKTHNFIWLTFQIN
jgi:hypothetical protein